MAKSTHFTFVLLLTSLAFSVDTSAQPERNERLIYSETFDSHSDWTDSWELEGLGIGSTESGHLELRSKYQHLWQEAYDKGELSKEKVDAEIQKNENGSAGAIRQVVDSRIKALVEKDGYDWDTYRGAHIVCWNQDVVLPENYRFAYTFKALSPIGLHVLLMNAQGHKGEDIFSDAVSPRFGQYHEYIARDISNYGISLFANNPILEPFRGTCNLRKNYSGNTKIVATGPDYVTIDEAGYDKDPAQFNSHRVEVIKDGSLIVLKIDGKESIRWEDEGTVMTLKGSNFDYAPDQILDTGHVLKGGHFGFRQMAHLHAWYDDIELYELID